jgi:hypothetical protein
MAIAGHVSPKMLDHYSHVRMQAKRAALDSLSANPPAQPDRALFGGGYDTNDDTNPRSRGIVPSEIIEKNGGDDETRTRDLCRDRAAF